MAEKFVQSDKPFHCTRGDVIAGFNEKSDPDALMVIVSRDSEGNLYLASTGSGDDTYDMLNEALDFIEMNTIAATSTPES